MRDVRPQARGTDRRAPYDGQDLEALADIPRYYEWVCREFDPYLSGQVLEVGAGLGNFSVHLLPRVERALLIEPDAHLFSRLDARFQGEQKVRTYCGTAGELEADGWFDAVVAVNVLEHIADDADELRTWAAAVRPGGAVLVFVPAVPAVFGTLDTAVGHHRRYTRERLRRVIVGSGLEVVRLHYFDSLGLIPWLVVGRLFRTRTVSHRAASLYDRVLVPILRRLEERRRPLLGKNLVCVARRPSGPSDAPPATRASAHPIRA